MRCSRWPSALHAPRVPAATTLFDPRGHRRVNRGKQARVLAVLPLLIVDGVGDIELLEEGTEWPFVEFVGVGQVEPLQVGHDPPRHQPHRVPIGVEELGAEPAADHGERGGQGVPGLVDVGGGPEQGGEPVTAVGDARLDREVEQQGEVLPGPEPDRVAIRAVEDRGAEAAESERGHPAGHSA